MEKENIVTEESEFKKNFIRIFKGSVIAILISIILLLIYALCLCYTNMSENTITPIILIITGTSILIGSMISTKKIKKNGLLNGGMVGFVYVILLYMISSLCLVGFSLTMNSLIMIVVGIMTGMLGGIIGINRKHLN